MPLGPRGLAPADAGALLLLLAGCPGPTPLDPGDAGTAPGCTRHGDCPDSLVCGLQTSGQTGVRACLKRERVSYVATGCAGGDGSMDTPFCSIDAALAAGKAVLRLGPGVYPAQAVQPKGALAIYGSDSSEPFKHWLQGQTRLKAPAGAAVLDVRDEGSGTTDVTLDSLVLEGGAIGVRCMGQSGEKPVTTLRWLRGEILRASGVGILASDCLVTVQDARVHDNNGSAVELRHSTYLIQRSSFYMNQTGAQAAVYLHDDTRAVTYESGGSREDAFLDNCVAGNTRSGTGVAGVDCGSSGRIPKRILRRALLCANSSRDSNDTCALEEGRGCVGLTTCP